MLKVNESTFRNHLKKYVDQMTDQKKTILVTREDGKAVVAMSLQQYNNLMENIFILSNRSNYNHILEGVHQLENGKSTVKNDMNLEKLVDE